MDASITEAIARLTKALGPTGPGIVQHDGAGGNQTPMALVSRADVLALLNAIADDTRDLNAGAEAMERATERMEAADALMMALANALARAHVVFDGKPCPTCALLARAREWAR